MNSVGTAFYNLVAEASNEDIKRNKEVEQFLKNKYQAKEDLKTTENLNKKDFNFFIRMLNRVSYELYNLNASIATDDLEKINNSALNLISDFNNLVVGLSKIKYNSLNYIDHQTIRNKLNTLLPSLEKILNPTYTNELFSQVYGGIISDMINMIKVDVYDTVSYPLQYINTKLKKAVKNRQVEEFIDEGEEEGDIEGDIEAEEEGEEEF